MHPEPSQLAAIPLFAGLPAEEIEGVSKWMDVRTVDAGTRIISEGAPGYFFFVLQDGAAIVSHGEAELARIGPGDYFGEMAILGDGRRTASVTATAPSTLLVMFGTEFRQLERRLPETADAIRTTMLERLGPRG